MKTNRKMKAISATFLLMILSHIGVSQSNEIKIRFIGNAGLHLSDGSTHVYVDFPYKSGAYGYMEYESAELDKLQKQALFLFTHRHRDHYSKKLMRKTKKELAGKVYGNWNTKKLNKLNNSMKDFHIEALKTKHKFTFSHYSYVITWHGKKIFISGDTPDAIVFGKLNKVDWAFIPYWLYRNAEVNNVSIDAKSIGIYHLSSGQKIRNKLSDNCLLLQEQNASITVPY